MLDYQSHPEWDALAAAVRAAPGDDLPRLVAADWLDERADPNAKARAEFIRLQIGIGDPAGVCARTGDEIDRAILYRFRCRCRLCTLRRKESGFWYDHGRTWRVDGVEPVEDSTRRQPAVWDSICDPTRPTAPRTERVTD